MSSCHSSHIGLWVFGLLLIAANIVFGELPDFRFHSLTTEDGLSSNRCTAVFRDQTGYLWIGTADGLNRWDGYNITIFRNIPGDSTSVSGNMVTSIAQTPDGMLWIATEQNGLSRYDPATENFLRCGKENDFVETSIHTISTLYVDRSGLLWIAASQSKVVIINSAKNQAEAMELPASETGQKTTVTGIAQDFSSDEIFWVTGSRGIFRIDRSNDNVTNYSDGVIDEISGNEIVGGRRTLCAKAHLIFGRSYFGICMLEKSTKKTQCFPYSNSKVVSFWEHFTRTLKWKTVGKEIWVGSNNQGLGIFSLEKQEIDFFPNDDPDPKTILPGSVNDVFEDETGITWIATGSGLSWFDPLRQRFKFNRVPPISPGEASYYYVEDVLLDTSANWRFVATIRDVNSYVEDLNSGEKWPIDLTPLRRAVPEADNHYIRRFFLAKNEVLYLATSVGLWTYHRTMKQVKPVKFDSTEFNLYKFDCYSITESSDGNIWLGGWTDGLVKYNPDNGSITHFEHNPLVSNSLVHNNRIMDLVIDANGSLWIATDRGISTLDPDMNRFTNLTGARSDDTDISYTRINCLLKDRQNQIWIGNKSTGLDIWNPKTGRFNNFSNEDGLIHNTVVDLAMDNNGDVWVLTQGGLTRINPESFETKSFDRSDGMPEINNSFTLRCLQGTGEMVLCVKSGFLSFHPDSLQPNPHKPATVITSFKVMGDEFQLAKYINHFDTTVTLAWDQNFLTFEFAALNFTNSKKNQFSYKLEGFDDHWNEVGTQRFASYTDLPGGDFKFKLKAANNDGIWSESVRTVHIRIQTPFWKTTWFYSLMILICAVVALGIYRLRVRQIKREELVKTDFNKKLAKVEMEALRSQMNPHFLFNSLNSINRFILKNESEMASDYLTNFSRLIRLILQNSKSEVIPLSHEIEALKLYVEMEMLRFNDKFEYQVNIDKNVEADDIEIPPMVIQPYVENAIWHGLMHKENGKGKLLVNITKTNGTLSCVVEDNGVGREKAKALKSKSATKRKSFGMQITKSRIDMMNDVLGKRAQVNIVDLKDENGCATGTKVELTIPIE